jgi:hypothetical protein
MSYIVVGSRAYRRSNVGTCQVMQHLWSPHSTPAADLKSPGRADCRNNTTIGPRGIVERAPVIRIRMGDLEITSANVAHQSGKE